MGRKVARVEPASVTIQVLCRDPLATNLRSEAYKIYCILTTKLRLLTASQQDLSEHIKRLRQLAIEFDVDLSTDEEEEVCLGFVIPLVEEMIGAGIVKP